MQSNAQLEKLPAFIKKRKENFQYLTEGLTDLQEHVILPEATINSDPSWFGFPLTVVKDERLALIKFLEQRKIGTRLLFGGNLTRQPYFKDRAYRIHGELTNTDHVMLRSFWVGVYPGLQTEMLDYIIESFHAYYR